LGDVGKAKSGVGFPDAEQGGSEGTPFFKVSDMNTDGNENELVIANNYVTDEQINRKRWNVITDVPAIFFAKVGAAVMLNRKRLVRFPFLLDNNTMAYIFDKEVWDCDFGKTLFETIDLSKLTQTGALPSYNSSDVEEVEIAIPSKTEQERIGRYFQQLDNLITLHQRKYCVAKMAVIKPEKLHILVYSTNEWEQRKLSELIIEYKETVDSDCTLPILTSSKTEGVVLQEEHFGRVQQHDITGYNILPRNYCTYRNRSDGVDFTFNINRCCDKGIISKFYPVFYGKNSDIFFLSMVLNYCDEVVHEIAYTCTGTGQKVLSFLDLQKMNIRVPSYDEQKKISEYFEMLDNLITLHQCKPSSIENKGG
jgi:type I restriction enzyme S subunit